MGVMLCFLVVRPRLAYHMCVPCMHSTAALPCANRGYCYAVSLLCSLHLPTAPTYHACILPLLFPAVRAMGVMPCFPVVHTIRAYLTYVAHVCSIYVYHTCVPCVRAAAALPCVACPELGRIAVQGFPCSLGA
eukprot:scaffold219269_cov23-Tisochrysis_lutea.AAC.3